ncbi:MAG: bifunctional 5,10-methylenetetrahydrofolate dehydrogenase/5,10-methenyltetrahydrofolate cyclohydrolase [Candidatus Omnitrophica bacterium]|nr:bifunctional 5,10-methylenetetrahydrofolate dehydrogenase/5,10-methenyltetrahydrofolate cyclohydrolase [Candidatus Omnitrophota bacterium]
MANIRKCKPIADKIKKHLKKEIITLSIKPKLVAIQIGKVAASEIYVTNQKKQALQLGIDYELRVFEDNTTLAQIEKEIDLINKDNSVTAVIIQKPLPEKLRFNDIILKLDPLKDAECMHPQNLGRLIGKTNEIAPCTPMAVMSVLKNENIDLYGKDVVVVGHSEIVGKPLALMLLNEFATVSVCHIGTSDRGNLKKYTSAAEILIIAVGKAGLIKGEHVKKGAIVIDVGINKVNGNICGDVDVDSVSPKALLLTPVPGGIGSLTTIMLMKNVVKLCAKQKE